MNILDHYKQSHDLRASEDYEVSINDQGAELGTPAPVEGRFFYPDADAPRPQYEGDMLGRTGQALKDVGQTAKSMAVGAGAGMVGLPGDVVAIAGGLARLLFPGDEGSIQSATDTITKISEAIGSERFLGLYRDLVNESDMSPEDKQMALDATETGSFFSLPGAVPAAQAVKRGAKAYAAGAPARVAERQSGTTLASGVDPTAMIDDIITAQARYFETGKFEPPTAENPVSVVKPTEQEPGIIAFHGSGADFDEFRLEMIGTGEGAQAYGYGLYFTDSEDIAKFYRNSVGGANVLKTAQNIKIKAPSGGTETAANFTGFRNKFAEFYGEDAALFADRYLGQFTIDPDAPQDVLIERAKVLMANVKESDRIPENAEEIVSKITLPERGKMYKVGLAPKPEDMLDYQGTFADQPKKVQDALKAIGYEVETNRVGQKNSKAEIDLAMRRPMPVILENLKGGITQDIRAGKQKAGKTDKILSEKLLEQGVPGIKYRAAGSRGANVDAADAEMNYVIFDDKAVKILEKYGIVGPVAVTAGATSQTDTEADDGKTT
tara:strand:- start:80 stop:1729 length:1650 start_codon:yes stop_codon:yes gene_type:complete